MRGFSYFIIIALSFLSVHSTYAQADFYVQGNSFIQNNDDIERIHLGAEVGLALKKWDLAGTGQRSFSLDADSQGDAYSTFLGAVVARRMNLLFVGLRFPLMVGMTSSNSYDVTATDSYLTISPGAQICIGKYRTSLGLGYQYFYSPDATYDYENSGTVSAFIRVKLF